MEVSGSGFWCGTGGPDAPTSVNFGTTSVSYGNTLPTGQSPIELLTDTEILVDAPPSNSATTVNITVSTPCGTSSTNPSDAFTYEPECQSSCSVNVSATAPLSSTDHPAGGILDGELGGFTDGQAEASTVSLLNSLKPSRWRVQSPDPYMSSILPQLSPRPAIEDQLESSWLIATGSGAFPPWSDNFATWDTFVKDQASGSQFCGAQRCVTAPAGVNEWDTWNEPISYSVYSPEGSVSEYLQLFKHTYGDIKSVSSSALVVAPSVSAMLDYVPQGGGFTGSNFVDFKTLLAFASSNGLKFDVYSFHLINDGGPCGQGYPTLDQPGCNAYPYNTSDTIRDEVTRVRNLLNEYPSLLPASVEVNEVGGPGNYNVNPAVPGNELIPGWAAGTIAAIEYSGASGANLSCWPVTYKWMGLLSESWDQCKRGMDGLLIDSDFQQNSQQTDDSVTPEAIYWVYQYYASMAGNVLPTSSSVTDISAFATRDDTTSIVKVLLGRHKRCSVNTSVDPACPAGGSSVAVPVDISWPYAGSTVTYTLQQIPDKGSGLGGPEPSSSLPTASQGAANVVGGNVTISIPTFADGDAYELTIAPG